MKPFSKFLRAISLVSIVSLVSTGLFIVGPAFPAQAAIEATDYFTMTTSSSTVDAGGSITLTISSKDSLGAANPLEGADFAYVEIHNATTHGSSDADVTAIGGDAVIKASQAMPWAGGPTTAANVAGASDTLIAVNFAGASVGTVTVRAGNSSFEVFAWAQGAAMNEPGDTPLAGQAMQIITVAAAVGGADHIVASFGSATTAEVGQLLPVTITQVNTGGGLVTSALSDVIIDIAGFNTVPGENSSLIRSSTDHNLGPYGIVKFTSAYYTDAYYMASAVTNSTFTVMGGTDNFIYGNSNVVPVTGLSAGVAVALDPGDVVTRNTASVINTQGETTLVAGDIVSLAGSGDGQCGTRGYFSVVSTVNSGADSTVTVIGPVNGFASCTTGAGNITKMTLTPGSAGAYTVKNGLVADGYIYSVGGVATGNETTTTVTGRTLTNGTLSAVVVPTGTGTLLVVPITLTLLGDSMEDTVEVDAATSLAIQGYGPPNGQTGMPTFPSVDFMFSKDPDPTDTIFPLTNTASSVLSITAGGVAAIGQWSVFSDTWDENAYRVSFQPSSPLTASTVYTTTVSKSFVSTVQLPGGMTALTDGGSVYSTQLTTGTGGGSYVPPPVGQEGAGGFAGGFTGTFGGEFPPMAHLSYPQPGMWQVPTNIACVTVGFDRPMQASSLTTSNIYIKKLVGGVESAPAGTPAVTALQGNESVCISGYTFEANTDYRVVVTRDVRDEKGTQLAGMPESNGTTASGFGFGYANMGPFREQFKTGAGAGAAVAPNLLGLNINQYKSGGSITGVPTSIIVRASFGAPLNPSTVNSTNVTLKRNGTVPVAGTVYYDAMSNSIEFEPTSILSASTSYTFAVSTSVTSVSGTAISAVSSVFTTGAADAAKPQVVFADADNYGVHIQFNEALNETTATNRSFYTIKTCGQAVIASDGASCTGGGAVTTVSLLTGVNAHYERSENAVWMDGLTLTAGDGFYIGVGTGVTDVAGNGVHATENKSWTGVVMGADKFAGGQGMFNMGTIGMEDFDMKMMGMKPINAMPMNTMAGATTKYFIDIPIGTAIPSGGYIELTFPAGFVVTGAKRDAQSPMNSDFNGPGTGTVTFATSLPTITGLTDGGGAQANDGVGYITAARKVIVKLSAATQTDDFLHFDLDGITNSSEPKSFDTEGYKIDIKTFNTSGALLEAMSTMPFSISSSGTGSVAGQVKVGATGLNGAKVFLGSPMTGPMEITTSNDGAGTLVAGSNDGEYKFENLPSGQYFVFTEPMFTSGETDYYGNSMPEPLTVSGATTKNIAVTAATATGKATLPVTITFDSLPVGNLGFNDSIDIFAFNPSSRIPVVKTVSRATLGTSPYTVDLYLPAAGDWNVGIGPSMPKGPMGGGMGMIGGGWMPPQNVNVIVAAADLGGDDLDGVTLPMSVSDKTITGKVLDDSGSAVANADVSAYDPQSGKNSHATAGVDGSFTLNVTSGSYKVGASLPGLPSSQETPVLVSGSSAYVNGSATASTGADGANPFNLKIVVPDTTTQGKVATAEGSPIAGASVWAHRTDAPSLRIGAITDEKGNYTLYTGNGAWKVEGEAPNYGYLGSKTLTVSDASLSSQNFEVASDLNTVTGTINIPGTSDDSGTMVYAYGDNGSAEAKTGTNGTYTLNLPDGTYDIGVVIPGTGDLAPLTDAVVDGNEMGVDFSVETPRTFTVTLSEAVTEDTTVKFFDANGAGNELLISEGDTSGTIILPEGTYYLDADVPGADFEDLTIAGGEFNNPNGTPVTTDQVNIDGAGAGATADNITITLPTMYAVTGRVTTGGAGVNDVFVSVYDQSTGGYFGTTTANNAAGGGLDGEYSIKLQAGTYGISADKSGYSSTPVDLTVSAISSGNDFVLTASSRTITGTVSVSGVPIANALVSAEQAGGGFTTTETSTDGTYTLYVDPGVWTVNAVADGYSEGIALNVDVTSASESLKNFSVTALTGGDALQEPTTESVTPGSGGTVIDEGTNVAVIAPPNALSTSTDAGQMSISETNAIMETPTATPLGNGYELSATDSDGNPIPVFDEPVLISIPRTLAELTASGVDTPAEAAGIVNGYWDDTAKNWASLPTNCIYYEADGDVIPENTVALSATLLAANVDHIEFVSEVDHFTTFAPVIATGATPPATPAGLVATVGDGQATLTWTKNSEGDMSSYNIWEANVTEGILTTLTQASCGATTCSKVITGLTNGTAYSFQIAAVDTPDGNTSAYSSAANVTPAAATVSSTPGGGPTSSGGTKSKSVDKNEEAAPEEVGTEEVESGDDAEGEAEVAAEVYGQTPFVDVSDHWAKSYIENLYTANIVSGFDSSHFNPNANVTRAELTKMAVTAFNLELPEAVSEDSFGDVDSSDWYAPYVSAATQKGIVSGYDGNKFKPNSKITRAEAVKILVTATGADISNVVPADFSDVASDAWYYGYVAYAVEHGIINGYGNGKFGPEKNLTRAEAAKIISLILEAKTREIVGMVFESMRE